MAGIVDDLTWYAIAEDRFATVEYTALAIESDVLGSGLRAVCGSHAEEEMADTAGLAGGYPTMQLYTHNYSFIPKPDIFFIFDQNNYLNYR
jgi:hypothetical protein